MCDLYSYGSFFPIFSHEFLISCINKMHEKSLQYFELYICSLLYLMISLLYKYMHVKFEPEFQREFKLKKIFDFTGVTN